MLAAGTTLGPYKILAPLGAGGMGEVYRAHDTRLGRDVAIKVLSSHLAATPEVRARFEREARTISQLSHPHICTLFDVGHQDDIDYLVMELLEGETLAHRLEKGPLPVADVLSLGRQIAEALDRAHRAGVVHRDLKPGNVMLTKSGAKLMDFGLARSQVLGPAAGTLAQAPTLTRPLTAEGTIVGTFQYMAPEQLEGKDSDTRSDIWSLGCVLYEMATGTPAFAGDSHASLIAAILKEEPRLMTELQPVTPPALERVVRHCLEKSPDDRLQSAHDLAFDLRSLSGATEKAPGLAGAAPPSRQTASRRIQMLARAAALATIAVVAGHALWKPTVAPAPSYQRLTFRRGSIDHARFAPDGRTVVYDARWDGKPSEIFTLRPGNPESRSLGITNAKLLAVSSRGELAIQLNPTRLFDWDKGTLARVPLEGGEPRAIREEIFAADWTPDGTTLAIAPSDSNWLYLQMPPGTTIAREPTSGLLPMRVAQDGRAIAYWRGGETGVGGSLELAGSGSRERVLCRIGNMCTGIAWNPRTREVWFTETDTLGSTHVLAVSASGRRRLLASLTGSASLHDIAADGSVLLSMSSTRQAMHVLAPGQAEERDLSWLDGSWPTDLSPDGRMLLFHEQAAAVGGTPTTYLRSTDGSPAVRLGDGGYGALSPDRHHVVIRVGSERPVLREIPVGAGEARDVLTGDVVPDGYVWYFPDGRLLLFSGYRRAGVNHLFVLSLEGGTPQPITTNGTWTGQRPISPDGRWVATTDIWVNYILPAGGGPARVVPGTMRGEVVLGWTADSRGLYVFRRGEVPARIDRVDVDTGHRQLWKELGPTDRAGVSLINYALITPDGRSYAYTFERTQTDLYLVTGLE